MIENRFGLSLKEWEKIPKDENEYGSGFGSGDGLENGSGYGWGYGSGCGSLDGSGIGAGYGYAIGSFYLSEEQI